MKKILILLMLTFISNNSFSDEELNKEVAKKLVEDLDSQNKRRQKEQLFENKQIEKNKLDQKEAEKTQEIMKYQYQQQYLYQQSLPK
jgi:maltose-binding protein MalE